MQIISCQNYREVKEKKAENRVECDSSFIDGIFYRDKFFILTLSCGIFQYDKNFKKLRIYKLRGRFSINGDSLFLLSKDKVFLYRDGEFLTFRSDANILGYIGGHLIFSNMVVKGKDTFKIEDIESYKIYRDKLFIGTNGYGLYIIENSKIRHFIIGNLPSNFIKSISIYKDTIILGFSEPFSRSKVGFFYNNRTISVFEFSDDYITDIYSSGNIILVGTSNGLFHYRNNEFHKILDGYISKILHYEDNKIFFIRRGKVEIKILQ